jgi:hypothetical protein
MVCNTIWKWIPLSSPPSQQTEIIPLVVFHFSAALSFSLPFSLSGLSLHLEAKRYRNAGSVLHMYRTPSPRNRITLVTLFSALMSSEHRRPYFAHAPTSGWPTSESWPHPSNSPFNPMKVERKLATPHTMQNSSKLEGHGHGTKEEKKGPLDPQCSGIPTFRLVTTHVQATSKGGCACAMHIQNYAASEINRWASSCCMTPCDWSYR